MPHEPPGEDRGSPWSTPGAAPGVFGGAPGLSEALRGRTGGADGGRRSATGTARGRWRGVVTAGGRIGGERRSSAAARGGANDANASDPKMKRRPLVRTAFLQWLLISRPSCGPFSSSPSSCRPFSSNASSPSETPLRVGARGCHLTSRATYAGSSRAIVPRYRPHAHAPLNKLSVRGASGGGLRVRTRRWLGSPMRSMRPPTRRERGASRGRTTRRGWLARARVAPVWDVAEADGSGHGAHSSHVA